MCKHLNRSGIIKGKNVLACRNLLHPWEYKMYGASVENILAWKYIANMRIEVVSASVKNVLACRNLLHPWE